MRTAQCLPSIIRLLRSACALAVFAVPCAPAAAQIPGSIDTAAGFCEPQDTSTPGSGPEYDLADYMLPSCDAAGPTWATSDDGQIRRVIPKGIAGDQGRFYILKERDGDGEEWTINHNSIRVRYDLTWSHDRQDGTPPCDVVCGTNVDYPPDCPRRWQGVTADYAMAEYWDRAGNLGMIMPRRVQHGQVIRQSLRAMGKRFNGCTQCSTNFSGQACRTITVEKLTSYRHFQDVIALKIGPGPGMGEAYWYARGRGWVGFRNTGGAETWNTSIIPNVEVGPAACGVGGTAASSICEAVNVGRCNVGSFPSEFWNTCLYTGVENPGFVRSGVWTEINRNFGTGGPEGIAPDNFLYEWRRKVSFAPGTYVFHAVADDGVTLNVGADGSLEINDWSDHPPRQQDSAPICLSGDVLLAARYYERGGGAQVRIWWDRVSSPARPVEAEADGCNVSNFPPDVWNACLYTGVESPVFVRSGSWTDINRNFGDGGPVGIAPDNFSYVWRRKVNFAPGYYIFHTIADDGVWLDVGAEGCRDIDDWSDHPPQQRDSARMFLSGDTLLAAGYYERGGGAQVRIWWELVP